MVKGRLSGIIRSKTVLPKNMYKNKEISPGTKKSSTVCKQNIHITCVNLWMPTIAITC